MLCLSPSFLIYSFISYEVSIDAYKYDEIYFSLRIYTLLKVMNPADSANETFEYSKDLYTSQKKINILNLEYFLPLSQNRLE